MGDHHERRGTRRGEEALDAALDERDIRQRIDEPDASGSGPGDYDLRDVLDERARLAAAADVYTADEALEDAAGRLGRELPDDGSDDELRPA